MREREREREGESEREREFMAGITAMSMFIPRISGGDCICASVYVDAYPESFGFR